MKLCIKCKELQDEICFNRDKLRKDGLTPYCKRCLKPYSNKHYVRKTSSFLYRNTIISGKKECTMCHEYKNTNNFPPNKSKKDKVHTYCRPCSKLYYKNNATKLSIRNKQRKLVDVPYAIKKALRSRLGTALKRCYKVGSAVSDLGCSVQHLKLHLELFWDEGMSWDNYGRGGWVIDHIIPLDSFDLTKRDQFLRATNFTNLQPLWEKDNRTKWNRLVNTEVNT